MFSRGILSVSGVFLFIIICGFVGTSQPNSCSAAAAPDAPADVAPIPTTNPAGFDNTAGVTTAVTGPVFNLADFHPTADGKAKDTAAFQAALDAAGKSGGVVDVPAGNYLIGSIVISSNTTLKFEKGANLTGSPDIADYPLGTVRYEGEMVPGHQAVISATKAQHIAIIGPGAITGPPRALANMRNPRGPVICEFTDCKDVRLQDFSVSYGRLWSIHPIFCENLLARNLYLRSDLRVSNGDGIDVDSTKNVEIDHCDIDNGDDAISLKSGRGLDAIALAKPTENILITNCSLGSAFAGVGIGTEMSAGIRNVRIEHCTFTHGVNAIFIKSRTGRGGFIEDITGDDLTIESKAQYFVQIDLLDKGIVGTKPVTGDDAVPHVANFHFSNIKLQNVPNFFLARLISPAKPLTGLTLTNVTGTCQKAITIANVASPVFTDIKVTGFTGKLVTTMPAQ